MIIEDDGIILSLKDFEEKYIVAQCFLKKHGLMKGLYRRLKSTHYLPGDIVHAIWRARLREQLGHYTLNAMQNIFAIASCSRIAVAFLRSALSMTHIVLNEKEKQEELFDVLHDLLLVIYYDNLHLLCHKYLALELLILKASGFGLSLKKCIVSGETDNLCYISPKSGAVVTAAVGDQYADRIIKIPQALVHNNENLSKVGLLECMKITGFFIEKNILNIMNKKMPIERELMMDMLIMS